MAVLLGRAALQAACALSIVKRGCGLGMPGNLFFFIQTITGLATYSLGLGWFTGPCSKLRHQKKTGKKREGRACLVAHGKKKKKNPPAMQEPQFRTLGQEAPLEKEMATHSSILAWEIPWAEECGGVQPMG